MPDPLYILAVRPDRPERMALMSLSGALRATFATDDTRETIRAKLAMGGLVLADDGRVFEINT